MWEFDIMHKETKEEYIIFGYNLKHAFETSPGLDPKDWICTGSTYVD